jgi:hypothetical protein
LSSKVVASRRTPKPSRSLVMAQPLRIMSLHALAYCERLFYLEEVEETRVADERASTKGQRILETGH